jgi:phytoene dehydrogenase-like protein
VTASAYDVVIVGAGHNGLVAAFYLARAGLRTVVLERRELVGGACVTEEFAPGYRASTGAYVLSLLRDAIWRDMRLAERGIVVDAAGPGLTLFPGGESFYLYDDVDATCREISRLSERDARAYPRFEENLGRIAELITPMIDATPPDPTLHRAAGLGGLLRLGARAARRRDLIDEAAWLFATSASQFLDERFESEIVKATFGWHAINDSLYGPSIPGTAYMLLHYHAAEQTGGGSRSWGFVRGGIGRVTEAMAEAAREVGVEIRTSAEVERILVDDGRARGVVLAGGEQVAARMVVSNADPKRTFLGLVGEGELPASFVGSIRAYRSEGTSIKINLGVDALPRAIGMSGDGVQPYHRGFVELSSPLAEMDLAQDQARVGIPAADPHIELCIPTVHDPSLAPEGRHIITIDVNSQPYTLAEGDWDRIKDEVTTRVVAKLGEFFPGLPDSIVEWQVLTPLDLERLLGLTGGHCNHGDMAVDQLFTMRPVRGYADYRTPLEGLYLCGAGTHPGGGVNGANGRNCARSVIGDARRRRRRSRLPTRHFGGHRRADDRPRSASTSPVVDRTR